MAFSVINASLVLFLICSCIVFKSASGQATTIQNAGTGYEESSGPGFSTTMKPTAATPRNSTITNGSHTRTPAITTATEKTTSLPTTPKTSTSATSTPTTSTTNKKSTTGTVAAISIAKKVTATRIPTTLETTSTTTSSLVFGSSNNPTPSTVAVIATPKETTAAPVSTTLKTTTSTPTSPSTTTPTNNSNNVPTTTKNGHTVDATEKSRARGVGPRIIGAIICGCVIILLIAIIVSLVCTIPKIGKEHEVKLLAMTTMSDSEIDIEL